MIPSGLVDNNFEWVVFNNKLMAFFECRLIDSKDVPKWIKDIYYHEAIADREFMANIESDQYDYVVAVWVEKYYSKCDSIPDLDIQSGKTNKENYSEIYNLTKCEVDVIKEIATGDPDKWIAPRMNTARNTLRKHISHVSVKINTHSKAEIVKFAFEKQLV